MKKILATLLLLVLSILVVGQTSAQTVTVTTAPTATKTPTTITPTLKPTLIPGTPTPERCQKANDLLRGFIQRYKQNKERPSEQEMISRLEKVVARSKQAGKDTTALEADLKVLKEKVAKLRADIDALIALVPEGKNMCSMTKDQVKELLSKLREQMGVVHADAADIRSYYQETIKPELNALKPGNRDHNDKDENEDKNERERVRPSKTPEQEETGSPTRIPLPTRNESESPRPTSPARPTGLNGGEEHRNTGVAY